MRRLILSLAGLGFGLLATAGAAHAQRATAHPVASKPPTPPTTHQPVAAPTPKRLR